jgi:hypothetical protein
MKKRMRDFRGGQFGQEEAIRRRSFRRLRRKYNLRPVFSDLVVQGPRNFEVYSGTFDPEESPAPFH